MQVVVFPSQGWKDHFESDSHFPIPSITSPIQHIRNPGESQGSPGLHSSCLVVRIIDETSLEIVTKTRSFGIICILWILKCCGEILYISIVTSEVGRYRRIVSIHFLLSEYQVFCCYIDSCTSNFREIAWIGRVLFNSSKRRIDRKIVAPWLSPSFTDILLIIKQMLM